jgi:hypothetical protein
VLFQENGFLITGQWVPYDQLNYVRQLISFDCRCEISHPAAPASKAIPEMTTNSPFSRNKHRRRKDSMSFATGDSSSEEDTSTSESET